MSPEQPVQRVSAPGKLIVCGEHAVVYGQPAIAVPLGSIRARAAACSLDRGSGIWFDAPDLGRSWQMLEAPDDPLSEVAAATLDLLRMPTPDVRLAITSDIPVASGMGSGAAIATVVVRVLAALAGHVIEPADVSRLVFESEKRFHGTPSGIDNTVVAYEQPVWFQRRQAEALIEPVTIGAPLTLVVADSGVRSATHMPVGAVRERRLVEPQRYDELFQAIGECVQAMRLALAAGDAPALGRLARANHHLLQQIGVSSPELDRLVDAAMLAGALGAKLSGAGWGGVMFAVVEPERQQHVADALIAAGAVRVFVNTLMP